MFRNKSVLDNCNTILILIILVSLLLLGYLWYNKIRLTNEYFTTSNPDILIDPSKLADNKSIGKILEFKRVDLNSLNENVISNLSLLEDKCSGYQKRTMKDGSIKYFLLTGYEDVDIDLNSDDYKDVASVSTYAYNKNIKKMKDGNSQYDIYPSKLPEEYQSAMSSMSYNIKDLNFSGNSIADLVRSLSIDCSNNDKCNGYFIALTTDNKLLVSLIRNDIDNTNLRDYPYNINDNNITMILCAKSVLNTQLTGACANLRVTSKDIGKDCFGQLWAQYDCSGNIPEYSDSMRSLSYQELEQEIKDSSCYTNKMWDDTSYRYQYQKTMDSIKNDDNNDDNNNDDTCFIDKTRYILKTMLMPDKVDSNILPKYNKQDSISSTSTNVLPQNNNASVYKFNI
jgi:hypothetical protein